MWTEPIDPRLPWVRRVPALDEARRIGASGARLDALRRAGERLGDALRDGPRARFARTFDVSDLIYPARFAFQGALTLPWPYVLMRHRCLLVQVEVDGAQKNVLFNPTDRESARATPFFERTLEGREALEDWFAPRQPTVEDGLRALGLTPDDIDLIVFDHFHTQDLRPTLGTVRGDGLARPLPARFPNAYLLAPRAEWEDWDRLHPLQRPWFIADGKRDVDESRVVLTDADLALGEGCLLVRTPGHTSGHQTLFVHGDDGVFGCGENGTSADCWSPYESRLPGLRGFARRFDAEVVLNLNTPESAAEQYTSMVLERSIVDRVGDEPAFVQMLPSSEVTPSPLAPGVRPSVVFGGVSFGTLGEPRAAAE